MQQSLEGPALKLWANPRCPATFPQGFLSMYLIAGSEGLSRERMATKQENKKTNRGTAFCSTTARTNQFGR